ncbi:MAG: ATP-binding cassette domain-containing protein [Kiloniellaceae bacterium]
MEPNLFRYIWHHSKREQVAILSLVLLSLPFYFVALDLPKKIVNQGIEGKGFEGPGSKQPFLAFDLPFGETLTGAPVHLLDGFRLDQPGLLLGLSFSFLVLVFVNGGFKFAINTSKGRMGERMLRRLRYELADRILRFPIMHVRKVKQAEVATMIKDEVEPLGGFIGDAFIAPAFLGGQAITAMAFIMLQSLWLGVVAAAVVLVQAFLIPKLRVPILRLGRQRQLTARQLAGRIAEVVDGAVEVHAHDTSNLERADLVSRLGRIFEIRYEIYQRKFFVKFLNNFLAQLTPFVFYAGGGLLAIYGQLDIGALVAVIAAYKDLPGPIKELIDWDQQRNDVQIKYEQVIEQFQPGEILDPKIQDPDQEAGPPLSGDIVVSAATLLDDAGVKLVDSVSFTARVTGHIAIIGPGGSGKDHLALMLARLVTPTSGSITIGGRDLVKVPQAVTGRRISYVAQETYLFPLSVRDNLLYGLRHRPLRRAASDGPAAARRAALAAEAARAGNPAWDLEADWTDYAAAGAQGPEDINERIIEVLSLVDLEEDVYRFGLAGTIDAGANREIAEAVLAARAALPERLAKVDGESLVVHFDPDEYNPNATLGENLLFGTPRKPEYAPGALAQNPLMTEVLEHVRLIEPMLDMGVSIARTMVEIFADLPPGHPFFEQFSFIDADDLPNFRTLVAKVDKQGAKALDPAERLALRRLPLDYVEARHRLGLIDEALEDKAVRARKRFAERLAEADPDAVAFYRPDAYNAAASLQDNILFGRIAYGQAKAEEIVGQAMTDCLDTLGLRKTVVEAGLGYQVGIGGKRLSASQRQKIGLARALLKRPDLLIVNEALAVMDTSSQARVLDRVLEHRRGRGVIWVLQRPDSCERFDRVLVMHDGRIVEQGSFADLNRPGSALSHIMAAE